MSHHLLLFGGLFRNLGGFRTPFGTPAGREGGPKIAYLGQSPSKSRKNDVQKRIPEKDQNVDRNLIGKMMPKGSKNVDFSFVLLYFRDFGLSRKRFKN